jgi:hypothetical protein
MVRVSRRSVVICENLDNLLLRLMLRLGMAEKYEVSAVKAHNGKFGGMNGSHVPNFVYRWLRGELVKVFLSLDPTQKAWVQVTYAWDNYGVGGTLDINACFRSRLRE